MNVDPQTHPSRDELAAFSAGKLEVSESESIEQHLSGCDSCCRVLTDLPDHDTLVGLLRDDDTDASLSPQNISSYDKTIIPESQPVTNQGAGGATIVPGTSDSELSLELPEELRDHPRYRIKRLVGRGGMGDVYEAEHKLMNRPVALKVIKPSLVRHAAAVKRFRREVQAAARLRHPNIVTAFDAEQAGDLHYLVMEFVDGVDLDDVVKERGPLPAEEACDYIRQAAEGLQHAHDLGMVHRDIKPHNLMIEEPQGTLVGSGKIVKILDFGLANFANETAAEEIEATEHGESTLPGAEVIHHLTQAGTMMGTPDYIAPEQAKDAHTADIRSDIYSLGCTFYTLLTGKTPFSEGSVLEKIKAHTESDAQPLSDYRDDVPEDVEKILQKMMAKDPADRYQTPAEVAEALKPASGGRQPTDLTHGADAPRPPRIRRWTLAAASLIAALIAFAVYYIQTDYGVIRIEVADETLEVKIAGETITMKDGEKELTIRAGAKKLFVKLGDVEFYTNDFQLGRNEKLRLRVERLPGEIVVKKDGQRFDRWEWDSKPQEVLPANPNEVMLTYTESFGKPNVSLEGEQLSTEELIERLREMAQKNRRLVVKLEGDLNLESPVLMELQKQIYQTGVLMVQLPPDLQREARRLAENQIFWAKERMTRTNKLKNIGVALQGYHDAYQQFPPVSNPKYFDKEGKPHLSWRVHILPMMDYDGPALYKKFKLDEPWDSPHNIKLLDQMPTFYQTTTDPTAVKPESNPTKTTFLAIVGNGTAHEGKAGLKLDEFSRGDGAGVTAYVVDAGKEKAVPWTKPEDLPFDSEDPIRAFGTSDFDGVFLALMADGVVKSIPFDTAPEQLRNLFLRADGNVLDLTQKRTTPLPSSRIQLALERKLPRHDQWIRGVGFPADDVSVSVDADGHVYHWNVKDGKQIAAHRLPFDVNACAVSSDGRFLVAAARDDGDEVTKVSMWKTDRWKELWSLDFDAKNVYELNFIRDGRVLLTSSAPNGVAILDAKSGKALCRVPEGTMATSGVAVSPDGTRLFVRPFGIPTRKKAAIYRIADCVKLLDVECELQQFVRSAVWSLDGKAVIFGDDDGLISVCDANSGRRLRQWSADANQVNSLLMTPSGHLISGGTVRVGVWDWRTGRLMAEAATPNIEGMEVALSPDGKRLLTGGGHWWDGDSKKTHNSKDYAPRLWQLPESVWPVDVVEPLEEIRRLEGHERAHHVSSLDTSANGELLLSGASDGTARLWQLKNRQAIKIIKGLAEERQTEVALSSDARYFAVGDWSGEVSVFDRDDEAEPVQPVARFVAHKGDEGGVYDVTFLPDGRTLLTTGTDNTAKLWDATTGKQGHVLRGHTGWVGDGDPSPDGKTLVTASFDETIRLWNAKTGKEIGQLPTSATVPRAVAFSPDGAQVAAAFRDGSVRIFDVATRAEVQRFRGHRDRALAVAWTPDGRHVVSASYDRTLRVWSPATGREIAQATAEKRIFNALAVLPNGRSVAAAGGIWKPDPDGNDWQLEFDSAIRIWQLPESVWPKRRAGDQLGAKYPQSVEKGLKYLNETQHQDGHWETEKPGKPGKPEDAASAYPVAMTALAGMTMLMEGSTLEYGLYSDNLRKAANWLMAQSREDGRIAYPVENNYRYMFGHGYAMLFLSSVYSQEHDGPRKRKLKEVLTKAVAFTGKAKTTRGGWGYVAAAEGNNFDEAATKLQGLRAARNAGIHVPRGLIDAEYLRRFTGPTGGVLYMVDSKKTVERPALTAAALAGCEYDKELFKKWLQFAQKNIPLGGKTLIGHRDYAHYYLSQAVYILGNDGYAKLFPKSEPKDRLTWSKYREVLFDDIINRQSEDGSWSDNYIGPVYGTACSLTILQLDNDIVPIYQRTEEN